MSNENKKNGRPLLLLLHCWKDRQVNDIGKIAYKKVGDVKQFLVIEIPDFFDAKTPAAEWGTKLAAIRNRYVSILSLGEKDRLDLKVL